MVAILYNIRSLYNVGSIFRTADAAGPVRSHARAQARSEGPFGRAASNGTGVEKIYLCGITPAPIDEFGKPRPQFIKVSLGAEKTVKWEKVKSASRLIDKLKSGGYKIWAVEQSKKSIPYYRVKRQASGVKKTALIFGNEVKGLPSSLLRQADKILEIPMRGKKESLNVSVAFGIVVFGILYK